MLTPQHSQTWGHTGATVVDLLLMTVHPAYLGEKFYSHRQTR